MEPSSRWKSIFAEETKKTYFRFLFFRCFKRAPVVKNFPHGTQEIDLSCKVNTKIADTLVMARGQGISSHGTDLIFSWCPGDARSQGISSHGTELIFFSVIFQLRVEMIYSETYNNHLMGYFSAFWSSSRLPRATKMSPRRQTLLARVNWYLQSSLKHITE